MSSGVIISSLWLCLYGTDCILMDAVIVCVFVWCRVDYIHIGVGSNVVCSTVIGNARASIRGTDNRMVHAFLCLYVNNLMYNII